MLLSNALAFMALIGSAAAVSIEKRANPAAETVYDFADATTMPADCTSDPLGGPNAFVYEYDTAVASTANSNLIMLAEDTVNRRIEQIALAIKTDANCGTPAFTVGYCDGACTSTNFVALQKQPATGAPTAYTIAESGTSNCFFAGAAANTLIDIVPFNTNRYIGGSYTKGRFALRVSGVTITGSTDCKIEVASKMVASDDFAVAPLTAIVDQGDNTEMIDATLLHLKDYLDEKRFYYNTAKVSFDVNTEATLPAIELTHSSTSTQFFSGIKYLIQKDGAGCPATFTVSSKVGTTAVPEWSISTGVTTSYAYLRGSPIAGIDYADHEYVLKDDDDYVDLKTDDFTLAVTIPAVLTGINTCDFYVHAVFNFEKPEVVTTTVETPTIEPTATLATATFTDPTTTAASESTSAAAAGATATNSAQGAAINVAAGMVAAVAAMLA